MNRCARQPLLIGWVCIATTAWTTAQELELPWPVSHEDPVAHEQVVARRDAGKPFWETQWVVQSDGVLTQFPNPGSQTRGSAFVLGAFGLRGLGAQVGSWDGAAHWLAPLLRRPGDLLAATLAERHFAQLGRDPSNAALRHFLVVPATATTPPLARREQLDRELAVRLLQLRQAKEAKSELLVVSRRSKDPFLRRAAQEAVARFDQGPRLPIVTLAALELEFPQKVDLWFLLDASRIPVRTDLAAATRSSRESRLWKQLTAVQGPLSPYILSAAQATVDRPDEMPFELARTWGRARVDQCLMAMRRTGGRRTRLDWVALSGCFEVDVLLSHLQKRGVACTFEDGRLVTTTWWPRYEIAVTSNSLVVRYNLVKGKFTKTLPRILAVAKDADAGLAADMPEGSAWPPIASLPVAGPCTATVKLSPFVLTITKSIDAGAARAACRVFADKLVAAGHERVPADVTASWQRAFAAAGISPGPDGKSVKIEVRGEALDLWSWWPMLR